MQICFRVFAVAIASVVFAISIAPRSAASDEVFTVARLPVAAQADSAIAAKQKAEAEGRRDAMLTLLRRMTPRTSWDRLPTIGSGVGSDAMQPPVPTAEPQPASGAGVTSVGDVQFGRGGPTSLDDQRLLDLERSFEVFDEKSGPTTYRARITYRFKPDEIRNLLISLGIPYSEAQARKALVLPVLETANAAYLWERNNPWLRAWQQTPLAHELTPMVAPLGDLEDATTLTATEALALDTDKLAILADRYGVSQVIVARARLSQSNGSDRLRVRLINAYREDGALGVNDDVYSENDAVDDLADTVGDYLADGDQYVLENGRGTIGERYTTNGLMAGQVGDTLADKTLSLASGNFPRLADDGVKASLADYAQGWKNQTLIDHSRKAILRASAFFSNVDEWKRIRRALISSPLVGSIQVQNLSRGGADMAITTFGDPGKLVVAMENQGLSLWTLSEGPIDRAVWNIATPKTAARVPVRLQERAFQMERRPTRAALPLGRSDVTGIRSDPLDNPFAAEPGVPVPGSAPADRYVPAAPISN